jgi:IS5 family transposase
VQPKNITFPTDAKLLHAAIKGLNRLARRHGVRLRQSYLRVAQHAAMTAGRYAHAKQFNRHHRQMRFLRTRLGRLIRDIRRKISGASPSSRPSSARSRGPPRSARSASVSAAGSSIPSMPQSSNASAKARPGRPGSSA